jgi:hypothetical protein
VSGFDVVMIVGLVLGFLVVVLLIGASLVKRGHLTAHLHKQGNPPTDQP